MNIRQKKGHRSNRALSPLQGGHSKSQGKPYKKYAWLHKLQNTHGISFIFFKKSHVPCTFHIFKHVYPPKGLQKTPHFLLGRPHPHPPSPPPHQGTVPPNPSCSTSDRQPPTQPPPPFYLLSLNCTIKHVMLSPPMPLVSLGLVAMHRSNTCSQI